jgi:hypothetical protein
MTDQELKDLVASLAVSQAETDRLMRVTRESIDELHRSQAETDRLMRANIEGIASLQGFQKVTDQELKDLVASRTVSRAEVDKEMEDIRRSQRATDRQIKEQGKQIGGIHAKFGAFTEGIVLPSMPRILKKQFNLEEDTIDYNPERRKNGRSYELDALAFSNSSQNIAIIIEVKSVLNADEIERMRTKLADFRYFYPEHVNKTLYAVVAAVQIPKGLGEAVIREGWYLARISGKTFRIDVPKDFVPKTF